MAVRKKDYIETLASEFKEELNNAGIDLRADYDDDQRAKLELGRKMARRWYNQYKLWRQK